MKNTSIKKMALIVAVFFSTALTAQTVLQSKAVDIRLTGTSTLHDWEMKAANGSSEASFKVDINNKITSLSTLTFSLAAKSLKSDSKAMDKNTYKALNVQKNPNILFVMNSATIVNTSANNYQFNCTGSLTIAGTTKETELIATAKYNPADRSLTVNGIKKMKMTDFNVKPPTVMLGTIKTGNDISISYNVKFSR